MNKKRKLVLAASILSMAAVGGIAVGATTALFHEDAEFNVHIKAGKLDVGFYVEHMYVDEYDSSSNSIVAFTDADDMVTATNFPGKIVSGKGLDLAQYGDAEFTVDEIYPTMAGEIDYLVENNSKVAVNLAGETNITVLDAEGTEVTGETEKAAFLAQFEVVSTFAATQLDEYDDATEDVDDIYRFKVTFEFKDDVKNNDYMGYSVKICTSITATQVAKSSN